MRKGSGFSKIRVRELASAPLFAQETGERAAARAADMDRSEQVLGAVTTAIKMLPSLVHGQQQPGLAAATPAAPAPPAPAVSRFSSMAELLDSITKFTAPLRSELTVGFSARASAGSTLMCFTTPCGRGEQGRGGAPASPRCACAA